MTATRRQAREWAIQMLTAAEMNPLGSADELIAAFWNQLKTLDDEDGGTGGKVPHGKVKAFVEERVVGVLREQAALDAVLREFLTRDWDLMRLGTVERAVLRLAVWELKFSDVPAPVIMNEAVDLANWFSSPKSRTLINGILDRYAKTLRP